MIKIFGTLLILVLIFLVVFLVTGIFTGVGYVISLIFPLSLFQASILCTSATFVAGFIFLGIVFYDYLFDVSGKRVVQYDDFEEDDDEYDDEYDDDDEYEYDDDDDDILRPIVLQPPMAASSGKVGRNAPCPCGSGKKFKYCCGKIQ